jgi:GWxTD domain-containing protein
MRTLKISLLWAWVVLRVLVGPLAAQERAVPVSSGDIRFAVDHAGFRDSSGKTREFFLCGVGNDQLQFLPEGDSFVAREKLTANLYGKQGSLAASGSWDKVYKVKDFDSTYAGRKPRVETFSFLMDPGKYRLRVELAEKNVGTKGTWQGDVIVSGFPRGQAQMSEPVFLTGPLPAGGDSLVLVPDRLNPSRAFADSAPTLRWFLTLYGPTPPGARLLFTASGPHGVQPASKTRLLAPVPGDSSLKFQDSLGLPFPEGGTSLLSLALADSTGKVLARREASFAYNPFYAPLGRTFGEALEVLGYIGTSPELDSLKKAPPQGRRAAWEAFWKKQDPTAGPDHNDVRDEFYGRVAYANANFSRFHQGWKTDMGRVYIKFGPADDVERHPFDAEYPAYEVWSYFTLNRQFLFVDRHGLGEYTLADWTDFIKK